MSTGGTDLVGTGDGGKVSVHLVMTGSVCPVPGAQEDDGTLALGSGFDSCLPSVPG